MIIIIFIIIFVIISIIVLAFIPFIFTFYFFDFSNISLQRYGSLTTPANIWDILHGYVMSGRKKWDKR